MEDLTARASHFEFGSNWLDYVDTVDEDRISRAVLGLQRLFPDQELRGRRFLDIGSGSGLSMLAALRLGATKVVGFDLDVNSVAAARRLLERFAPGDRWHLSQGSVFDITALDDESEKPFDVVHSWGVLHHTGDMWRAIEKASEWVAEDGLFAIAIYRKTFFCGFWKREKRFYVHVSPATQAFARWLYKAAFIAGTLSRGRNPFRYIREYGTRGMSWTHDIHDWMGGYPYESASREEVQRYIEGLSFTMVRENIPHAVPRFGLFGSGCNEYIARRTRRRESKAIDRPAA